MIERTEAGIVRRIYSMYLSGMGERSIAKKLNSEGLPTRYGNNWTKNSIASILKNYTYAGNQLLRKTFRENHMTKHDLKNRGQLPQYHAADAHEVIISLEDDKAVQEEMVRRTVRYAPPTKDYTKTV